MTVRPAPGARPAEGNCAAHGSAAGGYESATSSRGELGFDRTGDRQGRDARAAAVRRHGGQDRGNVPTTVQRPLRAARGDRAQVQRATLRPGSRTGFETEARATILAPAGTAADPRAPPDRRLRAGGSFPPGAGTVPDEVEAKVPPSRLAASRPGQRRFPRSPGRPAGAAPPHRRTGGHGPQPEHLLTMAARPNITIQAIPAAASAYAGVTGAFAVAEIPGGLLRRTWRRGSRASPCGTLRW